MAPRRGNGIAARPPPARTPRSTARRFSLMLLMRSPFRESRASWRRDRDGAKTFAGRHLDQESGHLVVRLGEELAPRIERDLVSARLGVAHRVAEDVLQET